MVTTAVEITGVSKSFRSTHAVHELDLAVPEGALCGFLGPNGAGKSTTIRMIMSIILPDRGAIRVLGGAALARKDRIGYLPEERGVYRKMRVGEFLAYIARLKGVSGAGLRTRVREWLERIELPGVERKRCEELSKGMQQKVQFLAAVIHDPDLLILDEPFSGLDPVNGEVVSRLIHELHDAGKTIIFSTHLLDQAETMCDRIFLIHRGVKLLDDSMSEIRARFDPRVIVVEPIRGVSLPPDLADRGLPLHGRTGTGCELRLRDEEDPQTVLRDIAGRVPFRRLELRQVSLRDVFVRLVRRHEGEAAAAAADRELIDA